MRPINKILIHCTATKEGREVTIGEIREWHLARGWRDVGYHFLVDLNGAVEVGRPIEQLGAHCIGQNKFSIGIAYVGGLSKRGKPKDTRTKEQKEGLKWLLNDLKKKYPNVTIHGHNEFSNKACPCFDVQKEYSDSETEV